MTTAVVVKGDRAYYELTAERISCYVGFKHGGNPVDVLVFLKPYTRERMIAYLKSEEVTQTPARDEVGATDAAPFDLDARRSFVDEYLMEMRIKDRILTTAEVEKIDARSPIKPMAWHIAYNGLLSEVAAAEDFDIEDALADTVTIAVYGRWCDESGKQHRVDIEHHFLSPTAKDALLFGKSVKLRSTKDGSTKLPVNYGARLSLYDSLIQSVDGLLIHGEACTMANKSKWLPLVPVLFKLSAIVRLFPGASGKNE